MVGHRVRDNLAMFTANYELMMALNLMRLEQLIAPNMAAAKEGSEKHTTAVIRLVKEETAMLREIMEIREDRARKAGMADEDTITTDSDLYKMALHAMTEFEDPELDAGDLDIVPDQLDKVPAESIPLLQTVLNDMEVMINTEKARGNVDGPIDA